MISVLFVCMGNICRSPTAQGVFSTLIRERGLESLFTIDSAGTHDYHIGKPPDERSQMAAAQRNIDISEYRARQVSSEDFRRFNYILAMDQDNLEILRGLCPREQLDRLRLFLEFAPDLPEQEVPDPYWGGPTGFERVLEMVQTASEGLLDHIQANQLAEPS